jgi:hypothetical protein
MVMRRCILSRADKVAGITRRREIAQETMTPQEVSALMRKTISEALDRKGAVEKADLVRANVPEHAIAGRFNTVLMQVLEDRRKQGILA